MPPYRLGLATMCDPVSATFSRASSSADCPDAVSSPPTPPSSDASRFSTTSVVGFMIRV